MKTSKALLQRLYEYIRKEHPELLGFVNKKKYREQQWKKKPKRLRKRIYRRYIINCRHPNGVRYMHGIMQRHYIFCPDCNCDKADDLCRSTNLETDRQRSQHL